MSDVTIKRNDTGPQLQATLKDANDQAVDIGGASVQFKMRRVGGYQTKVDAAASIVGDGSTGQVTYDWQAGDTDEAGEFEGEFEVTFGSGVIETFPNGSNDYITITISGDIS